MAKELLRMEGITKIYGNGFMANKDISFSVNEGEIHALIGENGAGKTTLMKILFGLENCRKERFLLRGRNVTSPILWMRSTRASEWFISILCWFRI